MSDNTRAQYSRDVKELLPCSAKEKQRCIDELEADVTAFLEHHPDASLTPKWILILSGSPESIAKSFIDSGLPRMNYLISFPQNGRSTVGILALRTRAWQL